MPIFVLVSGMLPVMFVSSFKYVMKIHEITCLRWQADMKHYEIKQESWTVGLPNSHQRGIKRTP